MKEYMELLKKIPALYPLCAVIDGRLLSKSQMEQYASYPDIPAMLGETCSILNHQQQKLTRLLTTQQEQFVRNLKSYSESSDTNSS